ncbi:hypothetical protein Efla_005910 [Eimeria flavescens]
MQLVGSKFSLLLVCAALACWGGLLALNSATVEVDAAPRRSTRSRRYLARSSGGRSSSSSSSRLPRHNASYPRSSSHQPQRSPQRPPAAEPQHASPQATHQTPPVQQQHASPPAQASATTPTKPLAANPPPASAAASGPPPPAYPYANSVPGYHPSHAAVGQQAAPVQSAPAMHPPSIAQANLPAQAPSAPSGSGAPSFARTAISSAVGAAVGSMVGTSVANSLTQRSGETPEAQKTRTTTPGPTVSILPGSSTEPAKDGASANATAELKPAGVPASEASAAPQTPTPPLARRAAVRLTFPGLGGTELKSSFRSAESFGKTVQDAVVRSVGVPASRVMLDDVSILPGANGGDSSDTVVKLSLLPDERLSPREPSAQELAEEIGRQLKQDTSYLSRQLLLTSPLLPDVMLETDSTESAMAVASLQPESKVASATTGSHGCTLGMLFVLTAGALLWL